jgi:hypothetical protein
MLMTAASLTMGLDAVGDPRFECIVRVHVGAYSKRHFLK